MASIDERLTPREARVDVTGLEADKPLRSRNQSARAVALNAASTYATLFAAALVAFVSTPLLLHSLGTTRYGTLSVLVATAGYVGLVELGLGTATMTRTASAEVEGVRAMEEVLSTSIAMFALVGLAGLLLVAALSLILTDLVSVPFALRHQAVVCFVCLGAAQAAASIMLALTSFLLGLGRMHQMNLIGFLTSTMTSLAMLGAALVYHSLVAVALANLVGVAASTLIFWICVRSLVRVVRVRSRHVRREVGKRLLALGWRNAVNQVLGTLAFGSDLFLIGLLLGTRAAAGYAIALRGYAFLARLASGAASALAPAQSHRAALAEEDRQFDLFCIALLVALIPAVVSAATVGVFAYPLLHLWLGHVPAHASQIIVVFCVILVMQNPGGVSSMMLTSSELASEAMVLTAASATVNVVASVLLTMKFGVIGPALGSLIAASIFDVFLFPRRLCRILGHGYLEMFRRSVRPILLPAAALLAVLTLERELIDSGLIILPLILLASAIYAVGLWFTPAVGQIRDRLRRPASISE